MGRYLSQRLGSYIPVLFLVSVLVFVSIHLIPGDPIRTLYGPGVGVSEEVLAEIRHTLGLDQSLLVQYLKWVGRLLTGDFGLSIRSKQPVLESILQRLPATRMLASASMLVAVGIAFPIGIVAGIKSGSVFDRVVLNVARVLGLSVPSFALGILLILVFAVNLRLLPSGGYADPAEDPAAAFRYLILPALTQGLNLGGYLMGAIRHSVVDELSLDYVRTARAKGLPQRIVVLRHVLKNALISITAVIGWLIGYQLAGALVVETIFSWPGIGRLAYQAITARDFPMVQGVVLFAALGFLTVNVFVDLAYALLDPRIRLGGASTS